MRRYHNWDFTFFKCLGFSFKGVLKFVQSIKNMVSSFRDILWFGDNPVKEIESLNDEIGHKFLENLNYDFILIFISSSEEPFKGKISENLIIL